MISLTSTNDGRMNEHQERHLRTTCRHIDRKIAEIEEILDGSGADTLFPRYCTDLTAYQKRAVREYCSLIRSRLITILDEEGISGDSSAIPMKRAIQSRLCSIDCAAEELRPKYTEGFGDVAETLAAKLNRIAGELQDPVIHLMQYLETESEEDPDTTLEEQDTA
ncbi:hypothetical protein J2T58_000609 [Methanocalculus alkaliphilus]|uniref:hypothetical protein n=1 Tax=Methanocalculus alkaliphilus TaxID=768730 RepID=UPI0020A1D811|nr:hypothetical protein [Methanocalculus alkaliphilus]MCP1714764.1 hypothetical protein [Methanocalculus alkaliphilus]